MRAASSGPWAESSGMTPHVTVVGAGIAGLAAARELRERGLEVRTIEKSRGLGGRCATRRVQGLRFDHGAQYFTVRSPRFESILPSLRATGQVAIWNPRIVRLRGDRTVEPTRAEERYVGVPGMSALGHALAGDLPVIRSARIESLRAHPGGGWTVLTEAGDGHGPSDGLILTCPAPQAASLLAPVAPELAARCASVVMQPCWAAMAAFPTPLAAEFDAAFVEDECLAWVSRDSSKPGRPGIPDCWTLHATYEWSVRHLEEDPGRVAAALLDRLFELTGQVRREAGTLLAHRWRFARPDAGAPPGLHTDEAARIVVTGDWTIGARIEDAFISGVRAADAMHDILRAAGR